MTLTTKVLKKMVKQNIVVRMIFHRTRNTLWWYGYRLDFTASKVSKEVVFSGPYFPLFGLNTEIDSVFGHFSRSAFDLHEVEGWEGQISCDCVAGSYTIHEPHKKFPKTLVSFFKLLPVLGKKIIWGREHVTDEWKENSIAHNVLSSDALKLKFCRLLRGASKYYFL